MAKDEKPSQLRLRDYVRLWARTAFSHAIGPIDLWSGVGGALLTAIGHLFPRLEGTVNSLLWQVPLWAAGAIVVVRLCASPYWIWRDQRQEIVGLQQRLSPRLAITFDPKNSLCVHETFYGGDRSNKTIYVAVLPTATTGVAVHNCQGYLTDVRKLGNHGEWYPTTFAGRQRLEWGARGFDPLDVNPGTLQPLNVFQVKAIHKRIEPLVDYPLNKDADLFADSNASFKLQIVVVSDDCPNASISLVANIAEGWNKPQVSAE